MALIKILGPIQAPVASIQAAHAEQSVDMERRRRRRRRR